MLETPRALAADPQLAEGMIAQRVAECRQALFEDLFAVGDEEQARARQRALGAARSRCAAMTVLPVPVAETSRLR